MLIVSANRHISNKYLHSTYRAVNGVGKTRAGVMNDFARVIGNCSSIKNTVFDDKGNTKGAHFDAIQLVPRYIIDNITDVVIRNSQYALAELIDVKITNNIFLAPYGDMQAILGTDGYFRHIKITRNKFQLKGNHYITFNGLISGKFKNNYQITEYNKSTEQFKVDWEDAGKVPVKLGNARIGGQVKHRHKYISLWIKSFKNHNYENVEIDNTHNLLDTRGTQPYKSSRKSQQLYLEDFDREAYITEVVLRGINQELPIQTNRLCKYYQNLAKQFSSKVIEG